MKPERSGDVAELEEDGEVLWVDVVGIEPTGVKERVVAEANANTGPRVAK
jgi:hypothetical protein